MKKLLTIALAATLVGCNVDNPTENSYTDEQLDEGSTLTLMPSENMWVSFPEVVAVYERAEACMGMVADGPTVYFKSFKEYFNGGVGAVWGFHTKGTIYVNTDEYPEFGRTRDKDTDVQTLEHEFIHHILWSVTGDGSGDHGSEMFKQCGLGPSINN